MTDKSDSKKEILRKSIAYGLNYFARPLGNWATKGAQEAAKQVAEGTANEAAKKSVEELAKHGLNLKDGLNLGHPYVVLPLAALDIIAGSSESVRNYYSTRLVKLGVSSYFSFLCLINLGQFACDYTNVNPLIELPSNLLLAGSAGIDLKNSYKESGKTALSDLKDVYSDLKLVKNKVNDSKLVRKFLKRKQEKPID